VCEAHYPGGDLEWFFDQWVYEEGAPSYAWGWTSVQVNGQDYLLVSVDQTQSAAYPRFAMPIDVVADGTTYVVFNDTDVEHFAIPVPSAPATVTFDPDAWVLWAVRTQQAYATGPPKIVETSPPPGVLVKLQSVNTVSIFFTTPVNLSAADVSIVGDASGAQSFTLASGTNANPVVLNLDNPLPVDSFTLTVSDAVVNSTGGLALDGEVMDPDEPGALPSGDGSPGGDAIIRFTTFSSIPTVSSWGVASLALLISIAGTLLLRRSCGLRSSTGLI
jgi:hypothetical protein